VIRIARLHCAHSRGAVGVALAALLAQLAGFAELVRVLLIGDPAVAARADVIVPLGAFHAGLAVRAAAVLGVDLAAVLAQAAVLADLLGQQAFLALLAVRVAIDAVDDAGIIVVHALVHCAEAGVAQRAVHRVAAIGCAVVAEAAGVADGDGAAGALMAFAAQLVILADVALGAGGAVRVLHALRALVALLAPVGRVAKAHTAVVAMGFHPALVVAVNGAEQAFAHILTPVVVIAVRTLESVIVIVPKGVGMKLHARQQREQHHHAQQPRQEPLSTRRTPRGRSVHFFVILSFHLSSSSFSGSCGTMKKIAFPAVGNGGRPDSGNAGVSAYLYHSFPQKNICPSPVLGQNRKNMT